MRIPSIPSANNRILFVSNCGWSMYNYRLEVLLNFIQSGYEVHIIGTRDQFADKLEEEGCVFHHIEYNNRSKNILNDISFYKQLKAKYQTINPAIIFHYSIKPNIYGSLAAYSLSVPNIAIIIGLGFSFNSPGLLQLIVQRLYKIALKKTTATWFLNDEDAEQFTQSKLVSKQKTVIIKSEGINTNRFVPLLRARENPSFVFLMATRLLKSKGIEMYAMAARQLKRKGYNIECWLIGDLDKHPDSIHSSQLLKWKQEKIIHYMGFKSEVAASMGECDCFVLPTYYHEGVPRSLMEAASMQIPLIASNITGCKAVVKHNVNGLLFQSKDINDLVDKMEQMILMPVEKRRQMGVNGRALMIERFQIQNIVTHYQQVTDQFVPSPSQALQPVA